MTEVTLFGIFLAPLYAAIAQVESDNGATSRNIYQLTRVYVDDVNRITNNRWGYEYDDRYRAKWLAERMMREFWKYYGARYERVTGKAITIRELAMMHNVGYEGLFRADLAPKAEAYWAKVKRAMDMKEAGR